MAVCAPWRCMSGLAVVWQLAFICLLHEVWRCQRVLSTSSVFTRLVLQVTVARSEEKGAAQQITHGLDELPAWAPNQVQVKAIRQVGPCLPTLGPDQTLSPWPLLGHPHAGACHHDAHAECPACIMLTF